MSKIFKDAVRKKLGKGTNKSMVNASSKILPRLNLKSALLKQKKSLVKSLKSAAHSLLIAGIKQESDLRRVTPSVIAWKTLKRCISAWKK
jgi:hypothetical protein